jgi:two-component system sensor histidine kinase HydH
MDISRSGGRANFIAASFLAIVVIQAIMAYFISHQLGEAAVEREAEIAQEFLNSILRAQKSAGPLFAEPAPNPALFSFARHITELPDLIRANVYSPDGIIRYSSEVGLIGVKFEDRNLELEEAFAGGLTAELEAITGDSKAEHLALPLKSGETFIEAYIPVSGEDGRAVAVVELYKRPAGLATNIAALRRTIWLSAALAGLALLLILSALCMWVGRRTPAQ